MYFDSVAALYNFQNILSKQYISKIDLTTQINRCQNQQNQIKTGNINVSIPSPKQVEQDLALKTFVSCFISQSHTSKILPGLTGDRQVAQPLKEDVLKPTARCSTLPVRFLFFGCPLQVRKRGVKIWWEVWLHLPPALDLRGRPALLWQ